MKFLVCISHVPDTTTKIKFTTDGKALDKTGVTFVINPYDEFPLSYAVGAKEKDKSTQIDVVCVGTKAVEPTLRRALAIGADRAFRIDAEALDGYSVAKCIADHVQSEGGYDLILTGKESIDYNGSQVGAMLAELLNLPFASFVSSAQLKETQVEVTREISGGKENVMLSLPAVISAQKGLAEERIPSMRGIRMARRKPLKVITPQKTQAKVTSVHFEPPKGRTDCHYISPDNVEELVQVLTEKGVL